MSVFQPIITAMRENSIAQLDSDIIYPGSFTEKDGVKLLMVQRDGDRAILATGSGRPYEELSGEALSDCKICELTHGNRLLLNRYFPATRPAPLGKEVASIGLGDRLGLATTGHLKAIGERPVKPVLAQQSMRELTLTGRSLREVLDLACYAVFQEGYHNGFGADGDHLKTEVDIAAALSFGYTMITLDCSDAIDETIAWMSDADIKKCYEDLAAEIRDHYEKVYQNRTVTAGKKKIRFDERKLAEAVLIYHEAICFIEYIYREYIARAGREVDFEISIDETTEPTAPAAHYLVAAELQERGVSVTSLAPRFCGEFQKGVDYRGDIDRFRKEFALHAAIADHFGYRLSIHSGSDKFSVFPTIGEETGGRFHLKTSGTSWLEALRIIALRNPGLYRRMHRYALKHHVEARKLYRVSLNLKAITPLQMSKDHQLPHYLDDEEARQLMHISYGLLLQALDESGDPLFRDEIYQTLRENRSEYESTLITHIGRHLEALGT